MATIRNSPCDLPCDEEVKRNPKAYENLSVFLEKAAFSSIRPMSTITGH